MGLRLDAVGKDYGAVSALKTLSLDVDAGEFLCLLGPSGCGKTTLLRLIAGLERPSRGRVLLDGEDLTEVPAHRRDFGMVFQSLALFPHLGVADNIGYGLRIRGVRAAERRARVKELLELVRLPDLGARPVSALSGGQRQRVAIARALAVQPRLFLLDEPLSALDAGLREAMQIELRELQQRLGVTTIVVTHDQREAMSVADRIAVLADGELRQLGAPLQVYRRPRDRFVAGFIGQANLLPARWHDGELYCFGARLRPDGVEPGRDGAPALLCVRPEELRLSAEPRVDAVPARVRFVRDVGASVETHLTIAADADGAGRTAGAAANERAGGGAGAPALIAAGRRGDARHVRDERVYARLPAAAAVLPV